MKRILLVACGLLTLIACDLYYYSHDDNLHEACNTMCIANGAFGGKHYGTGGCDGVGACTCFFDVTHSIEAPPLPAEAP